MMKIGEQRILGINGAEFSISVGIRENGVPKGSIYMNDGSPGSETLLSSIDQLLRMLSIKQVDLEGICIILGPGSFTSLRVSLAVAQAMGLALNIPVYGIDNLRLIAATVPHYPHPIKVIQNAYKGEFYTATYSFSENSVTILEEMKMIRPQDFYENLKENDLILGNAVEKMLTMEYDLDSRKVKWNNDFHREVSGISVIEYFKNQEAQPPSDVPLEPIYIRLSDAEINYKSQFGQS
jgi:tRNA threonylcarbamoyladenosine biosynthesis protein TsaB